MQGVDDFKQISWGSESQAGYGMNRCLAHGKMAPLSALEDVRLAGHSEGCKAVETVLTSPFIQAFQLVYN